MTGSAWFDFSGEARLRERGLLFVRRMYLPRAVGLFLGVILIGVAMREYAGPLTWALLFLTGVVWPHVAYQLGRRSPEPYRTELKSLMVDSALGGAWVAMMNFNLLPSVVIIVMLSMDKLAVGGARFLAQCATAMGLACALCAIACGARFEFSTDMIDIVGALPLLIVYPLAVGITTYRLARRVRSQNDILLQANRMDGLTGVLNRKSWEEAVEIEYRRCARGGRPASLLMIDIDHFKKINDEHGHPAGDEVLRRVAGLLRRTLRQPDLPGRYGGEEFGVVLPDTALAGALVIGERIRAAIEAASIEAGLRCTASVGAAEFSGEDASHVDWIGRADRALYAAKQGGRNRVEKFSG